MARGGYLAGVGKSGRRGRRAAPRQIVLPAWIWSRLLMLHVCLFAALGSGCGSPAGEPSPGESIARTSSDLSGVTLKAIAVNPSPTTLFAGATESLNATGFYTDGSTQNITDTATWTSSNASVATVSAAGVVTAVNHGSASITAQSGTVKAKATVTVSVTLTSIAVTPASTTLPANTTQALKATGSYDNNTTKNLTSTVTWTSNNPAVATVTSAGLLVTVAPGTTTIMATASGSSAAPVVGLATITVDSATITSLTVAPANKKLALGTTLKMTATATFTEGTTQALVAPVVSWSSSNPAAATVNAAGLVSTVGLGPSTIRATPLGSSVLGTATVTVTNATLVSVAVTPPTPSVSAGLTQPFTATGTYTDGSLVDITSQVTWTSSATTTATISTAGLATTLVAGSVTITATDPKTKKTGTATLTVTPAVLQSIALSPPSPSVPAGLTIQLDAVGTWTDGTTQDVTATDTWTSSATSVATVSAGLVTGVTQGTTTITVKDPTTGVTQLETLVVTPGLLVSIAVTPANPSVPLDTTLQLVATGTYTDGSTGNISQSTTWTSANGTIAVANAPGAAGQVTALSLGSSVVTATDPASGIGGQTTVTAAPAILESLAITPTPVSLLTGQTQQLTATGTMSDGSSVGYTGAVTWTSSAPSALVSNASPSNGLITGVSIGTATVRATDPATGVTASVSVMVSVNTSDDAAQEFSPFADPVGNWAFGWENAPGAGFNVFPSSYNSGGSSVDYWYGADSSNQSVYAAHNATASSQTFDQAPLGSGQLALLPAPVAADTSQADARWTAPTAGVYLVTASFAGTSWTSSTSVFEGYTTCRGIDGSSDASCGYQQLVAFSPGTSGDTGNYACGQTIFGCNTCSESIVCPTNIQAHYCAWTLNSPGGCNQYPSLVAYFATYDTVTTQFQSTTDVAVLENGASLFSAFINLNGAGNTQSFTTNRTLNAGDTLDFEVGNGGDANAYDLTLFDAQVLACPPGGQTACNGACVDITSDPNNCGGCGQACSGSCVAGTCYAATAIAASQVTCAVLQGGTVACWGDNTEGELGNGSASGPLSCVDTDRQCSYTPTLVNGLDQVTAVAAGYAHVCALQSGGTLACWGYDADGQLGDGEVNGIIVPSPTPVPGLTGVVAVSGGQSHTCALLSDGTVDCWGSSETGQVGNGSNGVDVLSPTPVPGLTNATAISAGYSHTCALLADGTVQCWGDNGVGELGIGSTSGPDTCNSYACNGCGCATTPVAVPGIANAIAIAAGTFDTCALIAGGAVECWGDNTYGQLGIGESTGPEICTFRSDYPCSTSPVPVSGLTGATAISLGVYTSDHACAIVAGGAVQCWGWNIYGQLGDGTLSGPETCAGYACSTTPVSAGGLIGVTAIVAGGGYTCAILPGGKVDCWGDASDGAVGDGPTGVGLYGGNGYALPSPTPVIW